MRKKGNTTVKPTNAIAVVGVILAAYLYSALDSMFLAIVVCILALIIQISVESAQQAKNRNKSAEKLAAHSNQGNINRIMELAQANEPSLNGLSTLGVRILVKGIPKFTEQTKTTVAITSDFCCLKNRIALMNVDTDVDFVEGSDLISRVNFVTEKYEYTITGKTAMDVQGAAILGNVLGGIGAAASAAANAAQINSEGGLTVHQKMTAYHIYLNTPGQETQVKEICLMENGKLSKIAIPPKMDKKTANELAARLNLAKNTK